MIDRLDSIEGRGPDILVTALSKLSCRCGAGLTLDPEACRLDLRYEFLGTGLPPDPRLFVQVADAGSLGGGILSYLLISTASSRGSVTLGSLRLRLSFLLSAEAEKADSLSVDFSTGL